MARYIDLQGFSRKTEYGSEVFRQEHDLWYLLGMFHLDRDQKFVNIPIRKTN